MSKILVIKMVSAIIDILKQYFTLLPEMQSDIMKYLKILLCFIAGLILLPVILLSTTVVIIARQILSFIYIYSYKGRFSLVSPRDSAFALEKHANMVTLTSFLYTKGTENIRTIRNRFSSKVISYRNDEGHQPFKKLKWRLIRKFGFFTWEDTDGQFDISRHVKLCPGADLLDRVYTEQEVLEAVEKLVDDQWGTERPQWDLLLVPKVKLEGNGDIHHAIILRIQHAYMDGISVLQMLQKGIADDPNKRFTIDPRKLPSPKPTVLNYVGHYMLVLLLGPYTLYNAYRTTRAHPANVFQEITENKGPKYYGCTTMKMTMDNVKAIRKAFKCSATAVFNSVIAGALRIAAERKGLSIPEQVDFNFTAAVLPYPNENPQNRFCIVARKSPVAVSDPRCRLAEMDAVMKTVAAHEISTMYLLGIVTGCFPAFVIEKTTAYWHSGYVVTNLPGFAERLHVGGSKIEMMYGVPPIKNGVGFGIGVNTYMGNIRVLWVAEKSSIISSREDMRLLVADYEKEFSLLASMTVGDLKVNNN